MIVIGDNMSFDEGADRLCRFARASLECTLANGRLLLSNTAFNDVADYALALLRDAMGTIRQHASDLRQRGSRRRIPNQDAVFAHLEEDLPYIDLTAIMLSRRVCIPVDRRIRLIKDWLRTEFFPTYTQTAIDILQEME